MLFAALTLIPAVVSLLGTKVFWPSKSWQRTPRGSLPQRLGRTVARRPAPVALASGGLLVVLALGVLGFKPDYDQFSQLPQDTESAKAFKDLQAGFPAGALNPTQVYLRSETGQPLDHRAVDQFAAALEEAPGVGSIMKAASDDGEPQNAEFSSDGKVARINLLLSDGPYTPEALDTAGGSLRQVAHADAPAGTTALVGGTSAIFADVQAAVDRDLTVVLPLAGVLIAVILALLLRSLVAPIYLMLAVLLGFAAAIGGAVIAFLWIGNAAGMIFFLPIIIYLFVVAIGTDYNILMIARLREEAKEGNDPRTAADLSVEHAGPSVAAAGLILAGTFASLMLAGLAQLTQMGFAVSLGIILAAFVMSMFLVPSLTALIGHKAWWPGHGDEPDRTPAEVREPAGVAR
jgi:RND superfamily putative drug exporter